MNSQVGNDSVFPRSCYLRKPDPGRVVWTSFPKYINLNKIIRKLK